MHDMPAPSLLGQCLAEFVGTALLIFFGTGCVAALVVGGADLGLWEISLIWGLAVSLAVYVSAGISGAHLNPAVSVALCLFGGFDRRKLPAYILAQLTGAFLSAALVYWLYSNFFSLTNKATISFAAARPALPWPRSSPPTPTPCFRSARHSSWRR